MRHTKYWEWLYDLDEACKDTCSPPLRNFLKPEFVGKNLDDYEIRQDGEIVRKDRWETALRNIKNRLIDKGLFKEVGGEFEIKDVVQTVTENTPHWFEADFSNCGEEDFEPMNHKRFLITAIQFDVPYTKTAVFLRGSFYNENDGEKLGQRIANVTHYSELLKPPTHQTNHGN